MIFNPESIDVNIASFITEDHYRQVYLQFRRIAMDNQIFFMPLFRQFINSYGIGSRFEDYLFYQGISCILWTNSWVKCAAWDVDFLTSFHMSNFDIYNISNEWESIVLHNTLYTQWMKE